MIKFIEMNSSIRYKKYKSVPYIGEKKLKDFDKEGVVVGQTLLKKNGFKNKDIDILKHRDDEFIFKEKVFGYKLGYIDVGNHQYIILKKRPFFILIIFIVFLYLGFTCFSKTDSLQINDTGTNTVRELSKKTNQDMRIIISSAISCHGKKMENMNLKNTNKDRYLRYVFYVNDSEVYDSQLIEYNRIIQCDELSKKIKRGDYDVKVKVISYDLNHKLMGYHYVVVKMNVNE